jgi:plastocyanin
MFPFRLAAAAALALIGSAGDAQTATPVQTIQLYSYGYNPDPIILTAGQRVTLKFVNRAGKGHDFTAPRFFGSSKIVAGDVRKGEVELRGGQSASITLVPTAGRYKVHCGKPFHKVMGMRGDIIVR